MCVHYLIDCIQAVKAARKAFDEGPWPKMTAKVCLHVCMHASYTSSDTHRCIMFGDGGCVGTLHQEAMQAAVCAMQLKRTACMQTVLQERGRVLYRLADLMERHAQELAMLETLVGGLPNLLYFSAWIQSRCELTDCVRGF